MKIIFIIIILLSLSIYLIADTDSLSVHSGIKAKLKSIVDKLEAPVEFKVFLISMIPIFELRGSIPIGIHKYQLPYWKVIPISIAGNMIPIFFILLFFDFVVKICFKIPFLKKILEALFARTRKKTEVIEKYEEIGLMFFVAIPLPITGAWTGSLAAYLLGLNFWKSILFIFLGVLIAGVVVSFLTSLKWLGALIAAVALLYVIVSNYVRKKRKNIA